MQLRRARFLSFDLMMVHGASDGVGIEEHRFLRLRIILPFIQRLAIDWREFPFFKRFFFERFESAQLFVLCHREPEFEQECRFASHSLDFWRLAHEFKIFIAAAKSHHAFDACTVVPGTIKQNHFAGGGQFSDITLKKPLFAFFFRRLFQRDDTRASRI